ncbi:MAG: DUF3108 domain-containing protein [Ramlibacter sp.]|nr:DUF3108 domain-containing protein [Ramlibacter sp.]
MRAPAAVAWRPLALLTAAVLVAHVALLRAPRPTPVGAAVDARAFLTRHISIPPQGAAVAHGLASESAPGARATGRAAPPRPAPERVALPPSAAAAAQARAPAAAVQARAPAGPPEPAAAGSPMAPAAPADASGSRLLVAAPVHLRYAVVAMVRAQASAGQAELVWRHDGESYEARLAVNAPPQPTRTQRSAGRIGAEGLAPLRFSDRVRAEEAAHFQRDAGKVTFSSNKPDAVLLAGAQDRLSVLLQLGAMLAGKPDKFPVGTVIAVQTAGTREADTSVFVVEQDEKLELPGGTVDAVKLTRGPRREFDPALEVWLARGMDYVPVRLRLTQPNGDSVDYQWSSTDKG